jgi:hypothetical protein
MNSEAGPRTRADDSKGLLVPGSRWSVELEKCGHRARVEAWAAGRLPRRAFCATCRRWRTVKPATARKPLPNATRTVISERTETRDGRTYNVKVLASPRRAHVRSTTTARGSEGGDS